MPTLASAACVAVATATSFGRSLRKVITVLKPFGFPQAASSCLALVRSPCGLVVASYRSNGCIPTTFGGAAVLAIAPPAYGPPYAVWLLVLLAAYSSALRQWTLVITFVLMAVYQRNPLTGSSDCALSEGVVKIFARAAACTPVPGRSTWMSPASSRLSTSFGFTLKVSVILLGSWLALGSVAGFQCGFGTSVSCLLIW